MKKKYKITSQQFGLDWSATFLVSDELDEKLLVESLEFFSGGGERVKQSTNLIDTYLQFIGSTLIETSYQCGGYLSSILREWEYKEGYLYLDGRNGITLIGVDQEEFDDEFSVECIGEVE